MKKTLLLLLVVVALAGCSPFQRSQLESSRSRWQATNITQYRYKLSVRCFCPFSQQMPLSVEVRSGAVVSMQFNDGTPLTADEQRTFAHYAPIDALFDFAAQDIGRVYQIDIRYDPKYGFPTEVRVNPAKDAVDGGLSLTVSDFQALP